MQGMPITPILAKGNDITEHGARKCGSGDSPEKCFHILRSVVTSQPSGTALPSAPLYPDEGLPEAPPPSYAESQQFARSEANQRREALVARLRLDELVPTTSRIAHRREQSCLESWCGNGTLGDCCVACCSIIGYGLIGCIAS